MRLTKKLINKNSKIYDDYYKDGIIDGWDPDDKAYSYNYFFKIKLFSGKSFRNSSVLDVGCGSGDLIPYLRKENISRYIGIDIYEPAIKIAKKKYPGENFIVGDLLKKNFHKFDFVICSGALSANIKSSKETGPDNYEFLKAMVLKMWSLCKYGIAFNVFTNDTERKASYIFYYNLNKLEKICREIIGLENLIKILKAPLETQGNIEKQIVIYLVRNLGTNP